MLGQPHHGKCTISIQYSIGLRCPDNYQQDHSKLPADKATSKSDNCTPRLASNPTLDSRQFRKLVCCASSQPTLTSCHCAQPKYTQLQLWYKSRIRCKSHTNPWQPASCVLRPIATALCSKSALGQGSNYPLRIPSAHTLPTYLTLSRTTLLLHASCMQLSYGKGIHTCPAVQGFGELSITLPHKLQPVEHCLALSQTYTLHSPQMQCTSYQPYRCCP